MSYKYPRDTDPNPDSNYRQQSNYSPRGHLSAGLYIVATPIGNLDDITLRAINILKESDVIACENVRTTSKLLIRLNIKAVTLPYHERNEAKSIPKIVKRIENGQAVALVSEAGTPLVSDPGYKLISTVISKDLPVIPIPGPSSVIAALISAGLPTDKFMFVGFLPTRSAARKKFLSTLSSIDTSIVFFESPRRIASTLSDMVKVFGNRDAVIARELTKKFEQFNREKLEFLADYYKDMPNPKGEITIIVGPPGYDNLKSEYDIHEMMSTELVDGVRARDVVDKIASITGASRREVYEIANKIKSDSKN